MRPPLTASHSPSRPILWAALIVILALAGLIGFPDPAGAQRPNELRIYVSLPRQGANADTSRLIVRGLKAALAAEKGRVANRPVRLVQLDNAKGRRWNPVRVRANVRRAIADPRAVAYVGELNSEATVVARGSLAAAGMVMFSPVSTSPSLTSLPVKGDVKPSLFRAIPNDDAQAVALVTYLKRSKVRRLALIDDGGLYGKGLASAVASLASKRGIRVVIRRRADRDGRGRRALVGAIARRKPNAVLFAGSQSSAAAPLFREVHRRIPRALIFGGDALAHSSFARRIGSAQKALRLTRPAAHVSPRNRRARALGTAPDKVSVFAYDGMSYLLRAIRRSGVTGLPRPADGRAAVRDAVFSGRVQWGLAGPWKVRRSGDSSHISFEAIRLADGKVFDPFAVALRRRAALDPKRLSRMTAAVDPVAGASSIDSIMRYLSGVNPALITVSDLVKLMEKEKITGQTDKIRDEYRRLLTELGDEAQAMRNAFFSLARLGTAFLGNEWTYLAETDDWTKNSWGARDEARELIEGPAFGPLKDKLGGEDPESWSRHGVIGARDLAWELHLELEDVLTKTAGHYAAIENVLAQIDRWQAGDFYREFKEVFESRYGRDTR